ncbi:energy-coupling factor ABC transporter ATP-binding protein [Paenibacillus sp. CAA11]|uniref:ATP-binding cassette domain-containing protein n=1 Tax=Paenibacillus sp. CAA11 TaxID=1532905 RepID=UPI000D33E182|nr:ATP-binding cassette domain-containing protein [Paenibacillus sp. CAA11]AWB43238.1 energy-coupling factor ABC transporter ATP-binding protein [Paenibacillus sp. CAA11]
MGTGVDRPGAAAIELAEVSFAYGKEPPILNQVSASIPAGSWVSIVGANGCGKSTLGRLIGGLLTPSRGRIAIDGEAWSRESRVRLRQRIGMVFQNPDNQFVGATVEEDLAFGLEGQCLPRAEMSLRIERYAALLGIQALLKKHPGELSGGQKQRIAAAASLVLEPSILIFDEASSMLDEKARADWLMLLREMRSSGAYTLVSITHDAEEILASDRVLALGDGGLAGDVTPQQLFADYGLMNACRIRAPFRIQLEHELKSACAGFPGQLQEEVMKEILWPLHSIK